MKKLITTTLLALTCTGAFAHGGGNGGDDLEIALKKKALQIGTFMKSEMGKSNFKMINADNFMDLVNAMDINVTTEDVVEKYGHLRTCVNKPEIQEITCNLPRLKELMKDKEILTATIFHEILGLMQVELGYEENASLYPISSKIIPYAQVIENTQVGEAQIKPEYYGQDQEGYGVELINKKTKESIRLMCLNANVEVHRCKNFSLVRKVNKRQSPVIDQYVLSLSPRDLDQIRLESLDTKTLEDKLHQLNREGFKFLTLGLGGKIQPRDCFSGPAEYRYGTGLLQLGQIESCGYWWLYLLAPVPTAVLDTTAEIGKQVINTVVFPIKALINGIRAAALRGEIKKLNKNIELAREVLNLDKDLTVIGTSQKVSDEEYKQILNLLTTSINAQQQAKVQ